MQILLIISLVIALLAVLFAVQNAQSAQVTFLAWSFESSQALFLLLAVLAGVLISVFASLPSMIRNRLTLRSQRKKVAELEASLADHKLQLKEAHTRLEEAQKFSPVVSDASKAELTTPQPEATPPTPPPK